MREQAKVIESKRGGGGPGVLYFRLKPGDEALVRFLEQDDDIAWAMMHEIPVEGRQWGRNVPCLDQAQEGIDCPGCERDMDRRFKGFINLIWYNAPIFKRDKDGKIEKDKFNEPIVTGEQPQVAVWNSGIRLFEELDEINANYKGLRSRLFRVKRKGSGLDTKYVIVPDDIDAGPQPFDTQEQKLEEDKFDLAQFTVPSSYDDFMADLNGQPKGNGQQKQQNGGGEQKPSNPFLRNR